MFSLFTPLIHMTYMRGAGSCVSNGACVCIHMTCMCALESLLSSQYVMHARARTHTLTVLTQVALLSVHSLLNGLDLVGEELFKYKRAWFPSLEQVHPHACVCALFVSVRAARCPHICVRQCGWVHVRVFLYARMRGGLPP